MKTSFLSKRAATLVEVVITVVLLGIIVISTFAYYTYIITFSIKAENYASAVESLVEVMERVQEYKYDDPNLSVTTGQPPPNDYHYALLDSGYWDKYGGVRKYTVDESLWDSNFSDSVYKTVTVNVTWNDGVNRTLNLTVRKTK